MSEPAREFSYRPGWWIVLLFPFMAILFLIVLAILVGADLKSSFWFWFVSLLISASVVVAVIETKRNPTKIILDDDELTVYWNGQTHVINLRTETVRIGKVGFPVEAILVEAENLTFKVPKYMDGYHEFDEAVRAVWFGARESA